MITTSDYVTCARCTRSVAVNKTDYLDAGSRMCTMCTSRRNQQTFTKPQLIPGNGSPKWINAIGYVRFDLQVGQTIEQLYPPLPLSDDQDREIAFFCFPDANYHIQTGRAIHDFICTVNPGEFTGKRISVSPSIPGSRGRKSFTHDSEELFCTSLFCQVKSSEATRGATQSALVCMSNLPMPEVSRAVLHVLYDCLRKSDNGALLPEQPMEIFRDVYNEVCNWGPLQLGTRLLLKLQDRPVDVMTCELLSSDLASLQWSGVSGSFPIFGALTPSEDILEVIESVSLDLQLSVPWPRIVGKIQMLPSQDRDTCYQWLTQAGWDGTSLNFSPPDDLDALCALSQILRQHQTGSASTAKLAVQDTAPGTQFSLKPMLLLFSNPSYYPESIIQGQNRQLQALVGAAREVLAQLGGNEKTPAASAQVGMCMDVPSPFIDLPLCEALWPHISRIFKLWELIIAGESVLFLGADLPVVSSACLAAVSLISPLRFEGVLRPYLTITNRETDILLTSDQSQMPTLVGATNPFFLEKCVSWPNIVCFGPMASRPSSATEIVRYLKNNHNGGKVSSHTPNARSEMQFTLSDVMFSRRHFCVKSDKLSAEVSDGGVVGDGVLRKMLNRLTSAFLTPVHDHIVGVLRLHRPFFSVSNWQHSLVGSVAILAAIEKSPTLPVDKFKSRADMMGLYSAFLETPTFRRWRQGLCASVERELLTDSSSLEDVLLLDASPQTRFQVLTYLQSKLQRCLNDPLCDVALLKALLRHLTHVGKIRDQLTIRHAFLSSL